MIWATFSSWSSSPTLFYLKTPCPFQTVFDPPHLYPFVTLCHNTHHIDTVFLCSTSVSGTLLLIRFVDLAYVRTTYLKSLTQCLAHGGIWPILAISIPVTDLISWESSGGCKKRSIEQMLEKRSYFFFLFIEVKYPRELILSQRYNTSLAVFFFKPVSWGEYVSRLFGLLWEIPKTG